MKIWGQRMQERHGDPPMCLSWILWAFSGYYKSVIDYPDPNKREDGWGPCIVLIQQCALALEDGPGSFKRCEITQEADE